MTVRSLLPLVLLGVSAPALAHSRHGYDPGYHAPVPVGTVQVVNRAGTTLTVFVDGAGPRTLGPDQTAWISAPAGDVRVRATYVLFGQELRLDTSRVYLSPGRTATTVFVAPTTARVLVSNVSPLGARVLADGREVASLAPGQERLLALPARPTTLTLLLDGHVARTERLELRPYDQPRLRVELPTRGDLVVRNPLPIPVRLVSDRAAVRTVEPYGRTVYEDVPVGTFCVTATRLGGERIDEEVARVDPWTTVTVSVDPPRDGILVVDNDHWLGVRVLVDGRVDTTLAADRDARLVLPLGWHAVEARDETGRTITSTWVRVDAYQDAEIDVGTHRRAPPVADADDRHDRHDDAWVDDRGYDREDDGRYDDHTPAATDDPRRR